MLQLLSTCVHLLFTDRPGQRACHTLGVGPLVCLTGTTQVLAEAPATPLHCQQQITGHAGGRGEAQAGAGTEGRELADAPELHFCYSCCFFIVSMQMSEMQWI